jgi:hypothetical protein
MLLGSILLWLLLLPPLLLRRVWLLKELQGRVASWWAAQQRCA